MIVAGFDIELLQNGGLYSNVTGKKKSYDGLSSTEKLIVEMNSYRNSDKYYFQSIGTLADSKRSYYVLMPKLSGKTLQKEFNNFIDLYGETAYKNGDLVIDSNVTNQVIEIIDKPS